VVQLEETPEVTKTKCYKLVACVSGRFVALSSFDTAFVVGLTTRSKKRIGCFTSKAAAAEWAANPDNLKNVKFEGAPKAILRCAALGPVTVSEDGSRLSCSSLITINVSVKIPVAFSVPSWKQKNGEAVHCR
jgi:hypothetical protein